MVVQIPKDRVSEGRRFWPDIFCRVDNAFLASEMRYWFTFLLDQHVLYTIGQAKIAKVLATLLYTNLLVTVNDMKIIGFSNIYARCESRNEGGVWWQSQCESRGPIGSGSFGSGGVVMVAASE